MQAGDVFTLDTQAINEMENEGFSVTYKDKDKNEHRLEAGTQFRITAKGILALPVEVRAAKVDPDTGKCGRGRTRRFPVSEVARLLDEDVPVSAPAPAQDDLSEAPVDDTEADEDTTEIDEADEVDSILSDEEDEAIRERVAGLIDSLGESDDWD